MKHIISLIIAIFLFADVDAQKLSKIINRKENYIDLREKLALNALILSKYSIAPDWQTIMQEHEFEKAYFLPGGDYLLQTLEMKALSDKKITIHNQYAFFPHYGSVYRIDHKTGKVLWEFARSGEMSKNNYNVVALNEMTMIIQKVDYNKKHSFYQIDLGSGAILWEKSISDVISFLFDDDLGIVLFAVEEGSNVALKAFDYNKKQECYARSLGFSKKERIQLIPVDSGVCYLEAGRSSVIISTKSGEIIGKIEHSDLPTETNLINSSIVFCFDDNRLEFYDLKGVCVQKINTLGQPSIPVLRGNRFFWFERGKDYSISSIDTSWKQPWSLDIDSTLKSSIYRFGDTLCFTTMKVMYFVNAEKGILLGRVSTGLDNRLPDDVRKLGDFFVLESEFQVACFDLKQDAPIWKFNLRYLVEKYKEVGMPKSKIDLKGVAIGLPYKSSYSDYFILKAKDNLMKAQFAYDIEKNYSNALNLSITRQQYFNLVEINKSFEMLNMNFNILFSAYTASAAIMKAKTQEYDIAADTREYVKSNLLISENMNRGQFPYFMKRYGIGKGYVVLMVDIRNGKWAEIPVSPNEGYELKDVALLGTSIHLWNPENNTLMVTGLGLDPQKWEETDLYRATTIKRSVLHYNLDNLQFKEAIDFPAESIMKR